MNNELNLFMFITNIAIAVLIGALLPILPVLTRKSFLFGVKIPLEQSGSPEAKKLKKNYIITCLTGTAVIFALIIAQFIIIPDLTLLSVLYFPLLFVAVQMAGFIPNWKKALKLKEEKEWTVTESVFAETKSSHSRGNLSDLPWFWYIASLIIIFITVVIALVKYPELPDKIPTHFDINMQPDAWSDKNLFNLMLMPLINFATLALMWFVGFIFVKAKLQIDPQNPELSFAQHRIYRRRMGHSCGILALGMVAGMGYIGLMSIFPDLFMPFWLMLSIFLIPCIPVIVVPVISGQGGCKIKPKSISIDKNPNPSIINKTTGRGDDKYWLLGMFYCNPDDPAVMVEDRFGSNIGFNYSRLPEKIVAALGLLALVAMYVGFTVLFCSL